MFDQGFLAPQGWTPVNKSKLQEEIEAGLDVNRPKYQRGRSLLHVATLALERELVALLLEHGADPFMEDDSGTTPFDMAKGLRAALLAGGAGIKDSAMGKRLDASVALVEYEVAFASFLHEERCVQGTETGSPWLQAPIFHLASDGQASLEEMPTGPRRQQPPKLKRATTQGTVQGSATVKDCPVSIEVFSQLFRLSSTGHSRQPSKEVRCDICLESGKSLLVAPCASGRCSGAFCSECLRAHAQLSIGEMRYSVPAVRCPHPECRRRVPVSIWGPLVRAHDEEVESRIIKAGQALMKVRCPGCDQMRDLFYLEGGTEVHTNLFEELAFLDALALASATVRFCRGDSAEALLDALGGSAKGEEGAQRYMTEALLARVRSFSRLLQDPERAVALQLAAFQRYPLFKSPCCKYSMCFRCKVKGHHIGSTCEERQAKEVSIEAQHCPTCFVPTVKSEGCRSIRCVCGASWLWRD
mmetsp:Transcript_52471/g.113630  ORF Transcript_52471/g.113630 Transcript_52471/m.113630 type:complete len:471 (+) Transcript_52471:86-1498(+)